MFTIETVFSTSIVKWKSLGWKIKLKPSHNHSQEPSRLILSQDL